MKRGLFELADASNMLCVVYRKCESLTLSYGRGGRSPNPLGEVIYTHLEGSPTLMLLVCYFQEFVNESTRGKRVRGLKTKDAAAGAAAHYADEMAREGEAIKCNSGDDAGELGRFVKFQLLLTNEGIRWMRSRNRISQSNGIGERTLEEFMTTTRRQLARSGRGEDC